VADNSPDPKDKEEMRKELEEEIIRNLDLDSYNLTSDDLWSGSRQFTKGIEMPGHPEVPKLDFESILKAREQKERKKDSDSSEGESEESLEIDEDIG